MSQGTDNSGDRGVRARLRAAADAARCRLAGRRAARAAFPDLGVHRLEPRRLLAAAAVLEAEAGALGSLWDAPADGGASGGSYITVQPGNKSTGGPPSGAGSRATYPFDVDASGDFKVWGRTSTPSGGDDSFWVRIDGGAWARWNGIPGGSAWTWDDVHDDRNNKQPVIYSLPAGTHTLEVAYREDGSKLDKLVVQPAGDASPTGMGPTPVPPVPPVPDVVATMSGSPGADEGSAYLLDLSLSGADAGSVVAWTVYWGDGTYTDHLGGAQQVAHAYADGDADHLITAVATDGTSRFHALGDGFAGAADLDPAFGAGGIATLDLAPVGGGADAGHALAVQPDGKLVVAGGSEGDFALARFNADGTPDAGFGSGGMARLDLSGDDVANGVVVLPDGRILLAGRSDGDYQYAPGDLSFARFLPDGTPDPTFGSGGGLVVPIVRAAEGAAALAVQPDGKIVVGGTFEPSYGSGTPDVVIARLNPDGTFDQSFGGDNVFGQPGWTVTDLGGDDFAHTLLLQPDGRIVLGGSSDWDFALARYEADGTLDPSFGSGGVVTTPFVDGQAEDYDLALTPGGRILAVGYDADELALARYLPDGQLDAAFGAGGTVRTDVDGTGGWQWAAGHGVAVEPDGRIDVAGVFGAEFLFARYLPDGQPDPAFGTGGTRTLSAGGPGGARDLARLPDGSLVAAGDAGGDLALVKLRGAGWHGVGVRNVAPALSLDGPAAVGVNEPYAVTFSAADPGDDAVTQWQVDWGDGSAPATYGGQAGSASRTYATPGAYTVSLTATDDDGDWGPVSVQVDVTGDDPDPADGFTLIEEDRFLTTDTDPSVGASPTLVTTPLAAGPLVVRIQDLVFDGSSGNPGSPNDAFEVAVLAADGRTVLPTVAGAAAGAVFNWTETLDAPLLAEGVGFTGDRVSGQIAIDMSGLDPGITVRVVARLINNDGDTATRVGVDLGGDNAPGSTVLAAPPGGNRAGPAGPATAPAPSQRPRESSVPPLHAPAPLAASLAASSAAGGLPDLPDMWGERFVARLGGDWNDSFTLAAADATSGSVYVAALDANGPVAPNQPFSIGAGEALTFGFSQYSGEMNLIEVQVDEGQPPVQMQINRGTREEKVWPVDVAGTEYTVLSYGDRDHQAAPTGYNDSLVEVLPTTAATSVIVFSPSRFRATVLSTISTVGSGPSTTHEAGQPTQIQLVHGQALQLEALRGPDHPGGAGSLAGGAELSGTRILSSEPVLVTSRGSSRIPFDDEISPDAALYSPLPPVNTWGSEHIVIPETRRYGSEPVVGDRLRITPARDATEVFVGGASVGLVDVGDFIEYGPVGVTSPMSVTATGPILVAQYGQLESADGDSNILGGGVMHIVPPTKDYAFSHAISPTPHYATTPVFSDPDPWDGPEDTRFATIIAPPAAVQSGGILMNGDPLAPGDWLPIAGTDLLVRRVDISRYVYDLIDFGIDQIAQVHSHNYITSDWPIHVLSSGVARGESAGDSNPGPPDYYGLTISEPANRAFLPAATAATLAVTPSAATRAVGASHAIHASILDAAGRPVAGVPVTFDLQGANDGGDAPELVTLTDAAGVATFAYAGFVGADTVHIRHATLAGTASVSWINAAAPSPGITITSPDSGTGVVGGMTVLVSGQAFAGAGDVPIASVLVGGVPADVLDAAGHFFAHVDVAPDQIGPDGRLVVEAIATDVLGRTATDEIDLLTLEEGGGLIASSLENVGDRLAATHAGSFYNAGSRAYGTELLIASADAGSDSIPVDRLLVAVRGITEPSVSVARHDGILPADHDDRDWDDAFAPYEGLPYFDLSDLYDAPGNVGLDDGWFDPGDALDAAGLVSFHNPDGVRFGFDLVLLASQNLAPRFTTVPPTQAEVGSALAYEAAFVDPEGDPLTVELVEGPAMAGPSYGDGTATFAWTPAAGDVGAHSVTLRLSDAHGGSSLQQFTIDVRAASPNRPPRFVTSPVVEAHVNRLYAQRVAAVDVDGDAIALSLGNAPAGLTLVGTRPDTGEAAGDGAAWLVWDVPSTDDRIAALDHPVSIVASDGEKTATQSFVLTLLPEPHNRSPIILSRPDLTAVATGDLWSYDLVVADPDGDAVEVTLVGEPSDMSLDAAGRRITWTGDGTSPAFEVIAHDGRGGFDRQEVVLTPATALGGLAGTVWHDQNGNGEVNSSDVGLAGRRVFIDANADGRYNNGEPTDTSDSGGMWSIDGLPEGEHAVRVVPEAGDVPFALAAEASVVGGQTTQNVDFFLDVEAVGGENAPPEHDESDLGDNGVLLAEVGRRLTHLFVATDLDGDALDWALPARPEGAVIDGETGLFGWVPSAGDAGRFHALVVRVSDGRGGSDLRDVEIWVPDADVIGSNRPPTFASDPVVVAAAGEPYLYPAFAEDPEGDSLVYNLVAGEPGMEVSPGTGEFHWTPTANGTFPVVLSVNDGRGGSDEQAFDVVVSGASENRPPAFVSHPVTFALGGVGIDYAYTPTISDPEGDAVAFSFGSATNAALASDPAVDLDTATGTLTWDDVPAWAAGSYVVEIVAIEQGTSPQYAVRQRYTLEVEANVAPTINLGDPITLVAGQRLSRDAFFADPNPDLLTFDFDFAGGSPIGTNGVVQPSPYLPVFGWQTDKADLPNAQAPYGERTFTLVGSATDGHGPATTDELTVHLVPDTIAPDVDLVVRDGGEHPLPLVGDIPPGDSLLLGVRAVDDVAVTEWRLQLLDADGDLVLDSAGQPILDRVQTDGAISLVLHISGLAGGDYTLRGSAVDDFGNEGVDERTLTIYAPNPANAPTASIIDPAAPPATDGERVVVDAPTNVLLSLGDPNNDLAAYEVYLFDANGNATPLTPTTSISGGSFSGVAAKIDPALIRAGDYLLRARVEDVAGNYAWSDEVVPLRVEAAGAGVELGNFEVAFEDLSVPVGGLSLSFTRSYDSNDRLTETDLGHGWRFGLDFDISEAGNQYAAAPINPLDPLYNGQPRTVPVRVGGDRDVWLTMPDGRRARFNYVDHSGVADFESPPGVSATLDVKGSPYIISNLNGAQRYFQDWPPAGPQIFGDFTERYEFPGYVLTLADGTQFHFDKPESSYTDNGGYRVIDHTGGVGGNNYEFIWSVYEGPAELTRIETPDGQSVRFTDDGIVGGTPGTSDIGIAFERDWLDRITRLYGPADATGDRQLRVEYGYSTAGDLASVTRYTAEGEGDTVTFGYAEQGTPAHYLSSITDARGVRVLETQIDPDTGRVSQVRDASGSSVEFDYNLDASGVNGYVETLVNRVDGDTAHTTEIVYDHAGNAVREVRQVEDVAVGQPPYYDPFRWSVTVREFDADGNVTRTFAPFIAGQNGRFTKNPPAGSERSSSTYDDLGRVLTSTDARGQTAFYDYNSLGRLTRTLDPLGRETRNDYAGDGRIERTRGVSGETRYAYDPRYGRGHQLAGTTQVVGLGDDPVDPADDVLATTRFTYDANGRLEGTTDAGGQESHFGYDGEGRVIQSGYTWVDPLGVLPNEFVGTGTTYDWDGRVVSTTDANGQTSLTRYTPAGQVRETEDALGNVTASRYDRRGNLVETRHADGTLTRSVYDRQGRAILGLDRFHPDQLLDPDFGLRGTRTLYDALGRAWATERLADVRVTVGADPAATDVWEVTGVTGAPLTLASGLDGGVFDNGDPLPDGHADLLSRSETSYNADGTTAASVVFADDPSLRVETSYHYDEAGRQYAVTRHDVPVYDPVTETTSLIDQTSYSLHDAYGRLAHGVSAEAHFWNPDAGAWFFAADPADPHASALAGDVDAFPGSRVTSHLYDDAGRQVGTVLPEAWFYDPDTGTIEPAAGADRLSTHTTYDYGGRRVAETDVAGRTTHYEHDAVGRLAGVTLPAVQVGGSDPFVEPVYAYDYDQAGNQTVQRDALGRETTYAHDAQHRRVRRALPAAEDAGGSPLPYAAEHTFYDARGRVRAAGDFAGNLTVTTYDDQHDDPSVPNADELDLGRAVAATTFSFARVNALLGTTDWRDLLGDGQDGHDAKDLPGRDANAASPVDAGGGPVPQGEYDPGVHTPARLLAVLAEADAFGGDADADGTYAWGLRVETAYDALGRVAAVTHRQDPGWGAGQQGDGVYQPGEAERAEAFAYSPDSDGRLVRETTPEGTLNYEYDPATGRHERTWTDHTDVRYAHDRHGRLTAVTASELNGAAVDQTTAYAHDAAGRLVRTTLPNGVTTEHAHGPLGRLLRLAHEEADGTLIARFDYGLGKAGHRLHVEETGPAVPGGSRTVDYAYDGLYRLTGESVAGGGTTQYALDLVGNRLTKGVDGAVTASAYNARDQLLTVEAPDGTITTHGYDANGSLTTRHVGGQLDREYRHDLANRLTGADVYGTVATYGYDHNGVRVFKAVGGQATHFLIDARNPTGHAKPIEERATPTATPSRSYVLGHDVVAQADAGEAAEYLLKDGRGYTRALLDAAGATLESFAYDAFGEADGFDAAAAGTRFLAPDGYHDPETGLHYQLARYSDRAAGRFLGFDAYEGSAAGPLTLHKYGYAHQDPVNGSDPTGRFSVAEINISGGIQSTWSSLQTTGFEALRAGADGVRNAQSAGQVFASFLLDQAFGVIAGGAVVALAGGIAFARKVLSSVGDVVPERFTIASLLPQPGGTSQVVRNHLLDDEVPLAEEAARYLRVKFEGPPQASLPGNDGSIFLHGKQVIAELHETGMTDPNKWISGNLAEKIQKGAAGGVRGSHLFVTAKQMDSQQLITALLNRKDRIANFNKNNGGPLSAIHFHTRDGWFSLIPE